MKEHPVCHIRYRFRIGDRELEVLACGVGNGREVRVLDMNNKVLWHAPFRGTLNSNRARISLCVFLDGEKRSAFEFATVTPKGNA